MNRIINYLLVVPSAINKGQAAAALAGSGGNCGQSYYELHLRFHTFPISHYQWLDASGKGLGGNVGIARF